MKTKGPDWKAAALRERAKVKLLQRDISDLLLQRERIFSALRRFAIAAQDATDILNGKD